MKTEDDYTPEDDYTLQIGAGMDRLSRDLQSDDPKVKRRAEKTMLFAQRYGASPEAVRAIFRRQSLWMVGVGEYSDTHPLFIAPTEDAARAFVDEIKGLLEDGELLAYGCEPWYLEVPVDPPAYRARRWETTDGRGRRYVDVYYHNPLGGLCEHCDEYDEEED